MKIIKRLFLPTLLLAIIAVPRLASATILFQDNFESYTSLPGNPWYSYNDVTFEPTGGYGGSKGIKIYYPNSSNWGGLGFNLYSYLGNRSEYYIQYHVKVDTAATGGSKFLKWFGLGDSQGGYANTTFGMYYWSDHLEQISYGPGTGLQNDTQAVIQYAGTATDPLVSVTIHTGNKTVNDGQWHLIQAHVKYNTNGNRDGVYDIWYDGVQAVHAQNITNRNNANTMIWNTVEWGGYTDAPEFTGGPWSIYVDDVVISDSFITSANGTKYETENLAVAAQTSGIPERVADDSRFSNGAGTFFDATAATQFVTYDVPNITAGSYDVRIGVKQWNNKGIWQLAISRMDSQNSPVNLASPADEYAAGEVFTEIDLGNWTPATTSDKAFKFTVTGKNASSSGYGLAFDYIKLIPQ
jgi:hypothetical protein